jgi:hypothetical protein
MGPKAVRTAIGISTGIFLVAGSLALFYAVNQTLPYSQSLVSNQRLAKKNGVFASVDDYLKASNTPEKQSKRNYLSRAYMLASARNLIGKSDLSDTELKNYLADLESSPGVGQDIPSVFEQDLIAKKLQVLAATVLDKSDFLRFDDSKDFELKKRIFTQIAKVSLSMDGSGSFDGNMARVNTSNLILRRVYDFQMRTSASVSQKDNLIATCAPILRKPFDLPLMFRFEHLRIKNMIDVSSGIGQVDPESNFFRSPKPFSFIQKLKLVVPGVHSAWESRFHEIFSFAIAKCEPDPQEPNLTDSNILALTNTDTIKNQLNTEYIDHFSVNLGEYTARFEHKNWYLRHIESQQKKDQSTTLTSSY